MTIEVRFDSEWINATRFERSLQHCPDALCDGDMAVHVCIPEKCNIMVDAGVRLLSYVNQLSHLNKSVILDFVGGEAGTMGYLDRMGFFDVLSSDVQVLPFRPQSSRADEFRGANDRLVEIARINPSARDDSIPGRLVDTLVRSVGEIQDIRKLENSAFTIFSELIGNVYDHVPIPLDGFAVLQYYGGKRNAVSIAVSDSGTGIFETIRPALPEHYPEYVDSSDSELLVAMFNRGLSRYGDRQGSGLRATAMHALKFNASMSVRLPSCLIRLEPDKTGEYAASAVIYSDLPLIWGTHLTFDFRLDGLE
jgi:hypothetical protein